MQLDNKGICWIILVHLKNSDKVSFLYFVRDAIISELIASVTFSVVPETSVSFQWWVFCSFTNYSRPSPSLEFLRPVSGRVGQ